MSVTTTIAKRELSSYFFSPIAYVAMILFLAACGVAFIDDFRPGQVVAMRSIFDWMVWLLVFIVPVLCMGLLAQEFSSGTVETLMTAPVTDQQVVLGKFLGAMGFLMALVLPTLLYVVLLAIYGRPDYGPILSGYLGIVLVGALFTAVGLFCSALTRSQVVAAVSAAAFLFAVTVIPWWVRGKVILDQWISKAVDQFVQTRYADFSKGVIDTGNVVFFIACTVLLLFLTIKVVESRRWR